jgi:hypothetical protein
MGAHPSFVSQIINPALRAPLPARHLPTVIRVCRLSAEERGDLLALYARAHPTQLAALDGLGPEVENPPLRIALPRFGDPALRAEVEALIRDFAERVVALAMRDGQDEAGRKAPRQGRTP